jgi:hypothetical protein
MSVLILADYDKCGERMYTAALSSVTERGARMNTGTGKIRAGTALLLAAGLALTSADAFADDEAAAAPATPKTLDRTLDLRPPKITQLYTPRQLERLIAKMESDNIEEIEVEGARIPPPTFTPRVWPGIAAPFWALFHPTQAWRILAPIPPDQARDIGNQTFTTEGRLVPLGVPPGDPFKND